MKVHPPSVDRTLKSQLTPGNAAEQQMQGVLTRLSERVNYLSILFFERFG